MSARAEEHETTGRERTAVIACGALSVDILAAAEQNAWAVDIHPLPPLLHNHPARIAVEVKRLAEQLMQTYERVAIAYADCGTYGALDAVCERLGLQRLPGAHCYDVYAGADEIAAIAAAEPGTYLLTDFLAISFDRTVWRELGLDRYPELHADYFRHYRKVVWLAGRQTPDIERAARRAAERMGLPLEIRPLRQSGLNAALAGVLAAGTGAGAASAGEQVGQTAGANWHTTDISVP